MVKLVHPGGAWFSDISGNFFLGGGPDFKSAQVGQDHFGGSRHSSNSMLFKNFVQNPQDPNQLFSSEGGGGKEGKNRATVAAPTGS